MSIMYSWDENKTNLFNKFQFLWTHLKATIEKSKQKYKSDKLSKISKIRQQNKPEAVLVYIKDIKDKAAKLFDEFFTK